MSKLSKTPAQVPAQAEATEAPAAAAGAVKVIDPRLLIREQGFKGYWTEFKRKVRSGEIGSLPVVVGLIIIAVVFQLETGNFLTSYNLDQITLYAAGPGIMAVGIVFVLLLGEIDLAVGSVAGLAGSMWAVLGTHMPDSLAIVLGILSGTVLGAFHGIVFAKIGVPAFVVTLAGFLGWAGLQTWVMGDKSTITTPLGSFVDDLTKYYFADVAAAYGLAVFVIVAFYLTQLRDARRRKAADLPHRPQSEIILRTVLLALGALLAAYAFNQEQGLPLSLVIFLAILVITDFVLRRTTYGRQIFAVGGGVEAASRAGINVSWIRISVFMISGTFGAIGGLFLASATGGADRSLGGGNQLMMCIAAAVIGGTSLFGGRGKVWSALLGILVIQSIVQGLNQMNLSSNAIQYMITGGVLLIAVIIDSVSRKTQKTAGRA
ncbi:sugar ABC transporter permease [Streptomyces beijiangensis]|uniref:Xylose transport system permease protein XylH n=1 Tax=Streptomyces beijiangensis TaxID=163361 RepID=A0A939F9S9_9ACTN|nr:sugar ABC transporter permease [Streptomyces beijiangensis]MBO0513552.1 sugar ABC transporter permease [Streptomyces beijiangensis]